MGTTAAFCSHWLLLRCSVAAVISAPRRARGTWIYVGIRSQFRKPVFRSFASSLRFIVATPSRCNVLTI
ncbi:MAG: hypothetical protein DMF41_13215 [Verrucomicrobia bacterium]|nr:MAG: hypothetical protein DMF41_13215 [Verrucomicrobiota bacterium]